MCFSRTLLLLFLVYNTPSYAGSIETLRQEVNTLCSTLITQCKKLDCSVREPANLKILGDFLSHYEAVHTKLIQKIKELNKSNEVNHVHAKEIEENEAAIKSLEKELHSFQNDMWQDFAKVIVSDEDGKTYEQVVLDKIQELRGQLADFQAKKTLYFERDESLGQIAASLDEAAEILSNLRVWFLGDGSKRQEFKVMEGFTPEQTAELLVTSARFDRVLQEGDIKLNVNLFDSKSVWINLKRSAENLQIFLGLDRAELDLLFSFYAAGKTNAIGSFWEEKLFLKKELLIVLEDHDPSSYTITFTSMTSDGAHENEFRANLTDKGKELFAPSGNIKMSLIIQEIFKTYLSKEENPVESMSF